MGFANEIQIYRHLTCAFLILHFDKSHDWVLLVVISSWGVDVTDVYLEQAALDFMQVEKVRCFHACVFSNLDQLRRLEEAVSII